MRGIGRRDRQYNQEDDSASGELGDDVDVDNEHLAREREEYAQLLSNKVPYRRMSRCWEYMELAVRFRELLAQDLSAAGQAPFLWDLAGVGEWPRELFRVDCRRDAPT
ncbi:hypothetical protein F4821DRAFT_255325 [Hypoxylon rubiginosum]|uniref:Uncharacterized protein n=1 Tax=Hypoxylon rubiginosum TaxID=110542 RepID=A0ACC0DE29_9PEZI|nr:hypothetical protein F4821DRAFT_255325 [Hypoxylon rubiginosum]